MLNIRYRQREHAMDKTETNGYEVKIDYTINGWTVQDGTRKTDNFTVRFCDFIVSKSELSLSRDPKSLRFCLGSTRARFLWSLILLKYNV